MVNKIETESKSKNFILKNVNSDDFDGLLKLYNLMCKLYDIWGTGIEPDIEMSVKIRKDKVSYNRYAIPVVGTPAVTINMIKKVLEDIDAPPQLLDVIKERHTRRIRIIVGYDYDSGGKRVYFNEGDQAYGYEFRNNSEFITKCYILVHKADYCKVIAHLGQMGFQNELIETLLQILPLEYWSQVCERTNPLVDKENVMGYHIAASRMVRVGEIRSSLRNLMSLINTELDKSEFDLWLRKNEESYLSWTGIATDKNGQAEVTLYIRPDVEEWDDRYQPKDFLSFFEIEIMNM